MQHGGVNKSCIMAVWRCAIVGMRSGSNAWDRCHSGAGGPAINGVIVLRKIGTFVSKDKFMENALEQELLQCILQLDDAEKKSVLQMLKTFIKGREAKGIRVSIEEYNQELQETETEYERREYTTHEEFVKQMKKW